jgi:hypothetical protein
VNRRHAAVISLFLAVALLLGMVATIRTTQLGATASAPATSAAAVARRNRQLDRAEAALRKAAARRPPTLPALPARPAARVQLAAATATAPRTVYVRPAPIVHVVHRHGGEHEADSGDGGGFDD